MGTSLPLPLDHVVLLTENLERMADLFTGLGFTVTPRTEHSPAMGTANRCVMLGSTYIEILTVVRNTERSAGWRELLAQGGGLRGLALRTDDAASACDALNAAGLDAGEVLSFARQDETGQSLRFRICRVPAAVTPGYRIIVCEHQTPDQLWRPTWTRHRNGARNIVSAEFSFPDPAVARATLERVGTALWTSSERNRSTASIGFAPEGEPGRLRVVMDNSEEAAFLTLGPAQRNHEWEIALRPDLKLILSLAAPQ
jgi:catechol 2,3-dioxygenase-like lactoylglutathione lyase family enzyme